MANHFRRRQAAQGVQIFAAIGRLRLAEQALEGVEVLRGDLDRRRARLVRRAAAEAKPANRTRARSARTAAKGPTAGEGEALALRTGARRRIALLPLASAF
jgi:hypothetical protein